MNKKQVLALFTVLLSAVVLGAAYVLHRVGLFSFDTLRMYKDTLVAYVAHHPWRALMLYITIYTLESSVALPISGFLTVMGGYLFGAPIGALAAVVSATCGAIILFLATRFFWGRFFESLYAHRLPTIHAEFRRYGGWYLIVLRLIPMMPFFLTNILAALSPISLEAYIVGTIIGVIPSTVLLAIAGKELTALHSMQDIFTPPIITAFLLMAAGALLPLILYRLLWPRLSTARFLRTR
jgi:uncharacterized membrane protein YdjX (TVP38/TMEM64 family)